MSAGQYNIHIGPLFCEHTSVLEEYPGYNILGLLLEIIKHCNTGDWATAKNCFVTQKR